MTLDDIIASALQDLGHGTDQQTVEAYSPTFKRWANDAIRLIAKKYKKTRKETVALDSDYQFAVTALTYECIRIKDVRDSTGSIDFEQDESCTGTFTCDTTDTSVSVIYEYYPNELSSQTDTPDLPNSFHSLISTYIVARERSGGDPDTQGTASINYQMFNAYLAKMPDANYGDPKSYKIRNAW